MRWFFAIVFLFCITAHAARPTIVYDASGGSDTAASGAGPITAITGTNGDISGTMVTFNETVDLSGSGAGGVDLDAIWYAGNVGDRHLFRITAFTGGQATCTAVTVAETATATRTASNWAVGGKRQTLDNDTTNTDIADGSAGWTFELGTGTYTSAVTLPIPDGDTTNGPFTIRGASGADHPLLNASVDVHNITLSDGNFFHLSNVKIEARGYRACISAGGTQDVHIYDVQFDCTNSTTSGVALNGGYGTIDDCLFIGGGSGANGVNVNSGARNSLNITHNVFQHFAGGTPINLAATEALGMVSVIGNLIYGGAVDGISIADADFDTVAIYSNTIDGCSSDGIYLANVAEIHHVAIKNNLITGNVGYGINAPSNVDWTALNDFNGFYDNTSGNTTSGLAVGPNSVEISADPYTNAVGDDYSLNNTASAGASLRAAGFPGAMSDGVNTGYRDIGALQHQDSGGGGFIFKPTIRRHGN